MDTKHSSNSQEPTIIYVVAAQKGKTIATVVLCLIFGGMVSCGIVLGEPIVYQTFPEYAQLSVAVGIGILVSLLLLVLVMHLRSSASLVAKHAVNSDELPLSIGDFSTKGIVVTALIILICWAPWIIIQYPVSMNQDTVNQIVQFFSDAPTWYTTMNVELPGEYIDHHPVFDTLVFGVFYWVGVQVGNENTGLFLYSIFQCMLTAGALAASVCYLQQLSIGRGSRVASLAFVALFPVFPQWATTMLKDSLFSAVFVLFCLMIVEIWRTGGDSLKSNRFLVILASISLLVVLTKKPGLIVFIVCAIPLIVAYKGYRMKVALSTAAVLIVSIGLVPALVYPAIGGVSPGGRQEMFGPLMQQAITVVKECDDLTEDERSNLRTIMNYDRAVESYKPHNVDYVKNQFKIDSSSSELIAFLRTWASIGLRHPVQYIVSPLRCSMSLILPCASPDTYETTPVFKDKWLLTLQEKQGVQLAYDKPKWVQEIASPVSGWFAAIAELPVLGFLFSKGFIPWLALFFISIAIINNKKTAIALTPILISSAIVLLSPIAQMRYTIPLIYTIVITFSLFLHSFHPVMRWPVKTQ